MKSKYDDYYGNFEFEKLIEEFDRSNLDNDWRKGLIKHLEKRDLNDEQKERVEEIISEGNIDDIENDSMDKKYSELKSISSALEGLGILIGTLAIIGLIVLFQQSNGIYFYAAIITSFIYTVVLVLFMMAGSKLIKLFIDIEKDVRSLIVDEDD